MNRNLTCHLVFTKPNMEKKVALQLEQRGFETFVPTLQTSLLVGGQVSSFPKPLFSSWVFVHCSEDELAGLRRTRGVLNVVYRWSKPVVVGEAEVNTIKFVLNNFSRVNLINTGIQQTESPLPLQGSKLAFPLPSLGYCLLADERTAAKVPDPTVRVAPTGYAGRLATMRENFAYVMNQFPLLMAPKR